MKTTVVSFYTDNAPSTYYSENYYRLKSECENFNIPYDFRKLKSYEDYRLNCLRKPSFILRVLEEKKEPIVWLDIDSIVHSSLAIFDKLVPMVDIAFAYPAISKEDLGGHMPKASPIFCNYNETVIEFLKLWVDKCTESVKASEKLFDHEILIFRVLPMLIAQKKIKIAALPVAYCIWPGKPIEGIDPIITMGIANGLDKEKNLREFASQVGMDERGIQLNLNKL